MAQGTISGRVYDEASNEPLVAVHVSADRLSGTATDLQGTFTLTLDPGDHILEFSYVGYAAQKMELSLSDGQTFLLEIGMNRSSKMLDEVVVSAGKYEQKLSDVTVSMEVIKPYQLSKQNIVSLDMILEKTPGFSILDGQPSIRGGSGFSYGAGSRVLVLVDDLPMISADAGDIKWNYLPVENLTRNVGVVGRDLAPTGVTRIGGHAHEADIAVGEGFELGDFHGALPQDLILSPAGSNGGSIWMRAGRR